MSARNWWWAALSVAVMLGGAFAPWARSTLGPIHDTVAGTEDGNDGWLVVVAAVVAGSALAVHPALRRRWVPVVPFLAGCAGGAVVAYDINDIGSVGAGVGPVQVSAQWGIYVALAGSLSLLPASVALIAETPGS